jgi:hypothetical protein
VASLHGVYRWNSYQGTLRARSRSSQTARLMHTICYSELLTIRGSAFGFPQTTCLLILRAMMDSIDHRALAVLLPGMWVTRTRCARVLPSSWEIQHARYRARIDHATTRLSKVALSFRSRFPVLLPCDRVAMMVDYAPVRTDCRVANDSIILAAVGFDVFLDCPARFLVTIFDRDRNEV